MANSSCPDATILKQLLDGGMAVELPGELHAHLASCPACQKSLEAMAAGKDSWSDLAQCLRPEGAGDDAALRQALDRAKAGGASATTDGAAPVADETWSFLQPADNPDHLGRLDSYQILALIGKGGMGIVFRGFDEKLHRMVAIKVMAPQLATSAVARKRFIREARAAAAVSHDHVVPIYAVADEGPMPYLVMQLVGGQSLQEKLDRVGPLGLPEILRIGLQTAEGLAAAHKQGLVHRDVKPANILLDNGVERVKLTDFGLARTMDEASMTQSGVIAGSPQYMAPEQAAGEAVDHRADLFSLGSVLYAMCAGRAPFRASNAMAVLKRVCDETPTPIQQINPDVPDWLAQIIAKLHAKKPDDRFQAAQEVADLLGQRLAQVQQPGHGRWLGRPESSKGAASPRVTGAPGAPFEHSQGATRGIPKVGDRVLAPRDGEEWLYAGTVRQVLGKAIHVCFDSGELAWAAAAMAQPIDIDTGSRVSAAWEQGWTYYSAVVTARDGDRVHVVYDDDGIEEWTELKYLRVPSAASGPAASGPAAATPNWTTGDRVMAPWGDDWLYPARVREVNGDSVFVRFDDGATTWVKADDLRPLDIGPGSHVFDEWGYLVHVTERAGDRIHVVYDDGTAEWTTLQHICMPESKPPATNAPLTPPEVAERQRRTAAWGLALLTPVNVIVYTITLCRLTTVRYALLGWAERDYEIAFLWVCGGLVLYVPLGGIMLLGALNLKRQETRFVRAAALLAMLPLHPAFPLGIPLGMWILSLLKPERTPNAAPRVADADVRSR